MGGEDEVFQRTDSTGARSFLTDALGSTLALTDSTGTSLTQYTYEPFGNTSLSGSSTTNSFAYTGRELDATGLYFYRARYYNPTLQRFISEDPIGFDGGINLYKYAEDNPVNFTDPFGLDVTVTLYTGAGGFGHIGIGVNTNQTQGFYPVSVPIPVTLPGGNTVIIDAYNLAPIAAPGAVLPDDPLHAVPGASVTISTTPAQDTAIQNYIDARKANPGLYNLFGRNCTGFVRGALSTGGIPTQPGILPGEPFFPMKFPGHDQFPIH